VRKLPFQFTTNQLILEEFYSKAYLTYMNIIAVIFEREAFVFGEILCGEKFISKLNDEV